MRVADYIVDRLADAGIEHVFLVAGGAALFLIDAISKSKRVKMVCCHHEQAAAMAAEGYARARNKIGCVITTSGPGGLNAITGISGAWTDSVPVIGISGQSFTSQTIVGHPGLRSLGVQEINIIDIVDPLTKYASMVCAPQSIGMELDEAIYEATGGRAGPVWLDIPGDILNAQVEPSELLRLCDAVPNPNQRDLAECVAEVAEALHHAKRPLVHVGQGVRLAGAIDEFFYLVERCGLPFVTARNANDICESDHPLFVGRPGTFAQRGANFAVQSCDLYLAIGTRLSLAQTGYNAKDYARNAKVVVVDIDPAELNKDTARIDLPIQADAGDFLRALIHQVGDYIAPTEWVDHCKALQTKYPPVLPEHREPKGEMGMVFSFESVNSYHVADVLSDLLKPDDVIITDVGLAFQTMHQAFRVKQGQRFFSNGGTAAMGWGLPAAIGACIGTGRRTICVAGDGGFMMNAQELATLSYHRLPLKLIILNNQGYATIRESQANANYQQAGSGLASGLRFPSFEKLADANDIAYQRIESAKTLTDDLRSGIEHPGPILIEIMIDPAQGHICKTLNRREQDGTIKPTAIEDLYPFLDPQKIKKILMEESE